MAGANQDTERHDYISLTISYLKKYKRVKCDKQFFVPFHFIASGFN